MKVFLETFGCTANQSISESIAWAIKSIGYELLQKKDEDAADIYLCNTCTVKYTTEQKILSKIK